MFTTVFIIALYGVVAALAAAMTYCEQRCDENRSTFYNILGFIACSVWPLMLVAVAIAVWMPAKTPLQRPAEV